MNIVVTGSRGWADWEFVWKVLDVYRLKSPKVVTLIHGGHHSGVDNYVKMYCDAYMGRNVLEKSYPVSKDEWTMLGRGAGPLRNEKMIATNPDLCLAFIDLCTSPNHSKRPPHPSEGASHCRGMAISAKIPTNTFYSPELKRLVPERVGTKYTTLVLDEIFG